MSQSHLSAVEIPCGQQRLSGVLHRPASANGTIVVFVAGAPQYRVGSHRLFFQLAEHYASQQLTVLRADYRGSGDSPGRPRHYDAIVGDIHAQLEWINTRLSNINNIYLIGLCDGASAAMLASTHPSIDGLILVNPWSESNAAAAKTMVKHYYRKRLFSRQFWGKLLRGDIPVARAISGFLTTVRDSRAKSPRSDTLPVEISAADQAILNALGEFQGRVLSVHGEADLAGQRFLELMSQCAAYLDSMPVNITKEIIADADHTFSRLAWRESLQNETLAFLNSGTNEKQNNT